MTNVGLSRQKSLFGSLIFSASKLATSGAANDDAWWTITGSFVQTNLPVVATPKLMERDELEVSNAIATGTKFPHGAHKVAIYDTDSLDTGLIDRLLAEPFIKGRELTVGHDYEDYPLDGLGRSWIDPAFDTSTSGVIGVKSASTSNGSRR